MNRPLSYAVAASLFAGLTFPLAAQAQAVTSARQTWEYMIVLENDATARQQLNDAGAQGWELVSVVCTTKEVRTIGSSIGGGGTDSCWYYFKRPK